MVWNGSNILNRNTSCIFPWYLWHLHSNNVNRPFCPSYRHIFFSHSNRFLFQPKTGSCQVRHLLRLGHFTRERESSFEGHFLFYHLFINRYTFFYQKASCFWCILGDTAYTRVIFTNPRLVPFDTGRQIAAHLYSFAKKSSRFYISLNSTPTSSFATAISPNVLSILVHQRHSSWHTK